MLSSERPGDRLPDINALEVYLGSRSIPFARTEGGALRVPITLMPGVVVAAELRWARERGRFECVTILPLPLREETRPAVEAALVECNLRLPSSRFVATERGILHLAGAGLEPDGTLAPEAALGAIAGTRAACAGHFKTLFHLAVGPAPPAASGLGDAQLAELRAQAAARRPAFAARLGAPLLVEAVKNPWFKEHRILFIQSVSRIPALGVTVAVTPAGRLRLLAGDPGALSDAAQGEGVRLAGDDDARAYLTLATSWTRSAELHEMPLEALEEIPFRAALSAEERAQIARLRVELGGRVTPRAFARTAEGWRLDVWLLSVSRLLHRVADVRADGTLEVADEVVVPRLPVPPGGLWGMVGGRFIPIG